MVCIKTIVRMNVINTMKNFLVPFFVFWILNAMLLRCNAALSEKEPENNFMENALKWNGEKKVTGTFYRQDKPDVDFFFVEAAYPTMIRGELSAVKGVDSYIEFYHEGETHPFKVINDGQSSLGEKFGPIQITAPGVWMAVRSKQQHNQSEYKKLKYEFSVSLFTPPSFMEHEGNDSAALAEKFPADSNGIILGYYNNIFFNDNEVEKDFFVYDIKEEGKMLLNLDLTSVSDVDAILRVYDENGAVLATADENDLSKGESIRSLGIEAPTRLTISVNAKDFLTNFLEYYQLKVTHSPYESRFEYEPNDSKETASFITEEKTFAELHDSLDKDFFRVHNSFHEEMFVNVIVTPENFDAQLKLTDADGKITMFNDSPKDMPESFSNIYLRRNEELFFSVSAVGSDANEYKTAVGKYTIVTRFVPVNDNFEIENNNTIKSANKLFFDREISAYINPNDDVDVYRVKSFRQILAKLLVDGIADCKMNVSIADSDGIVIQQIQSKRMGEGISQTINLEPRAILKVECLDADTNLYQTPYSIKIEKQSVE